jgi:hypothetical protein
MSAPLEDPMQHPVTRLVALLIAISLSACASSDPITAPLAGAGSGGDGGGGDSQNNEDAICLLNNCSDDTHCGGCPDGLDTCLLSENRCVACDRETGAGCAEGESCTPYGNCVPEGTSCPTDGHGTPTVTCTADADCGACDPQHQVCDTTRGRCIACTEANTRACQSTDSCIDNSCMANCPSSCDTDTDCGQCGAPGKEAHACQAHRCTECSTTVPCAGGQVCTPQGSCKLACGLQDQGTCNDDADCVGCGDSAPKCHPPINGGAGTCGPYANGCSDLGQNAVVLPSPYDQVTNLCSNDMDCAGVGVSVNVGKLLRDLTNISAIKDANITYGMNSCASVNIGNKSCGVCVPCKQDSDCAPIDIDQFAKEAFGPLGSLAAAFLLDQVFGPKDHKIHMYCSPVANGYGACVPCSNFMESCSVGGYQGGGSCSHDVCQVGDALGSSCSQCAQDVCNYDSYCCDNQWDSQCVQEAEQVCNTNCEGGGSACGHDECSEGSSLTKSCSSCATAVCDRDPYCCNNTWDALCVSYVASECTGKTCGGSGSCAHDECSSGAALTPGCSSCASVVCNIDAYCCNNTWDSQCVQEAQQYCNGTCGGGGSCAHDECSEGAALSASCSSCATAVCNADAYCCDNTWDSQCVSESELYCAKSCGGNGGGSCAHDECTEGASLTTGCSSCVTTVCNADSFCCDNQWDSQCVDKAEQLCNKQCQGGGTCAHDVCDAGPALSDTCSSCATSVCAYDPYCCTTAWDSTCAGWVDYECAFTCQ